MALMPVNCWKICIKKSMKSYVKNMKVSNVDNAQKNMNWTLKLTWRATEMISWGRFLRLRRFLKGCLTSLAMRLASTSSLNSGSMLSVPRIFLSTAFPCSKWPRSIRLLGVSTTKRAPKVRRPAGMPAKPNEILQPHPPSILFRSGKLSNNWWAS